MKHMKKHSKVDWDLVETVILIVLGVIMNVLFYLITRGVGSRGPWSGPMV